MLIEGLPRVRLAEPGDEGQLMEMCLRLHEENGLFPMKPDKVRDVVHRYFERKGGIIGVVGDIGNIEASVCLTIDQFWYSDDWFLSERWNYVLPEFRKSTNAKDLIKFAEWCSKDSGLPLVIGVLSNERTEAKVELYKRSLGKPAGAYWVCNSAWAH